MTEFETMLRVIRENSALSDARLRDIQKATINGVRELMEVFPPRREISVGNTTNVHIEALPDDSGAHAGEVSTETPEVEPTGSRLGRLVKTAILGTAIAGAGATIPIAMNYFGSVVESPIVTEPKETDLYEYLENRGLNRIDGNE